MQFFFLFIFSQSMDLIYDGISYFYLERLGLNNALRPGNSDLNAQS